MRVDLIPAEPGYKVEILNAPSAVAAGAPRKEVFPVIAWSVCFYDSDRDDYARPFYVDAVYVDPCKLGTNEDSGWNSEYDYGAGTSTAEIGMGRRPDDQAKWRVIR